jgi:hypothetical protein
MGRISAWVSRWDRLTVTLLDGGVHAPVAQLYLRPGRRLVALGALSAITLAVVVAIAIASFRWTWVVPLVAIFIFGRSSMHPKDVVIRDPMLMDAAAAMARTSGRTVAPNRWRVTGTQVAGIVAELERLDALAKTLHGRSRAEQEQILIDLADPQVRPFLRRSTGSTSEPAAIEPSTIEPGFHQSGDPWPNLATPLEWPQYESRD